MHKQSSIPGSFDKSLILGFSILPLFKLTQNQLEMLARQDAVRAYTYRLLLLKMQQKQTADMRVSADVMRVEALNSD